MTFSIFLPRALSSRSFPETGQTAGNSTAAAGCRRLLWRKQCFGIQKNDSAGLDLNDALLLECRQRPGHGFTGCADHFSQFLVRDFEIDDYPPSVGNAVTPSQLSKASADPGLRGTVG